ncbi:MAG TPA: response regulator [Oscillatoriales cyanobacterium M59_W2019_021]|nr:MAG: adenylate/guanylate cyclase domain-containing response regulator [Cyanobacteria bacterium J055]HIK31172.1 response regulator [Oscillatoriales cyanobacterium M4454_W2019_049]HIK51404.1 response regulator [Oscillatoriales cyanobacterium M59_W2019_021]
MGEFEVGGKRQFLWVLPFSVDRGIDWTIAIVLPASDFANPTDAKTRTIFGLGLLAIPLAAIAGACIGRKFPALTATASGTPESVPPDDIAAVALPESPGDRPIAFRAGTAQEYPTFQGNRRAVVPAWQPGTPSIEFPVSSLNDDRDSSDRPIRLLVVDDDPTTLATLTEYLSSAQYKIFQASSSLEAIDRIENNLQPDLILFEAQISDLDGCQFCQKIRERFRFYELPIVVLTEPTPDATTTEVLDWGANDYLTKPIVKHELVSRIRTHLHLAHLNAAYSRFVPKQFLQLLQKDSIVDVKLGDNTLKEMSILFSDIRSFTTISEKMTPEENFRFINSYLSRMEPVIMANRGFIDKYIGDSIMALFSGSADDAIQAGIAMLHTLVEYNQHRANVGYPPVKIGIGINTGSLMLGTVGGINRMDGTVISDAVNLASRIESLTKEYGVSLLISHQTFAKLQNPSAYNMRLIERLKVKGKSKSVAVFEIFNGDPPPLREAKLATAGIFEEGVLFYYGSSFRKAAHQFEECLRQNPEDKVAQIYLDRCRQHQIT